MNNFTLFSVSYPLSAAKFYCLVKKLQLLNINCCFFSVSNPVRFRLDPDPCFRKNLMRIPNPDSSNVYLSISFEYAVVIFIGNSARRA